MRIIDGTHIKNLIEIGERVVIQKNINGKKSIFTGMVAIFEGVKNCNGIDLGDTGKVALFQINVEIDPLANYGPEKGRVFSLPSLPMGSAPYQVITEFPNFARITNEDTSLNTYYGLESSATEYVKYNKPEVGCDECSSNTKDGIHYKIAIPIKDFAFVRLNEYYSFLSRHHVKEKLLRADNGALPFYAAINYTSHSGIKPFHGVKRMFVGGSSTILQSMRNSTLLRQAIATRLSSIHLDNLQLNQTASLNGQPRPVFIKKVEGDDWKMPPAILRVPEKYNKETDELLFEIGQAVTIPYEPKVEDNSPMENFLVGTLVVDAVEKVEYIKSDGARLLILEPGARRNHGATFGIDGVTAAMTSGMSTSSTTITFSQDLNDTVSVYSALSAAYGDSFLTTMTPPQQAQQVDFKFKKGDIVYIKDHTLSDSKQSRKNREYVITGTISLDGTMKTYTLDPLNKKPINIQDRGTMMEEGKLIKAEKVTKRKFILNRDFGKYKKGQTFTRDELIEAFGKFQDARDIFILNKIYICAE